MTVGVAGSCECPIKGCGEVCEVRQGKRRLTAKCPVHNSIMMQGAEGQRFLRSCIKPVVSVVTVAEEPEVIAEPETEKEDGKWRFFK